MGFHRPYIVSVCEIISLAIHAHSEFARSLVGAAHASRASDAQSVLRCQSISKTCLNEYAEHSHTSGIVFFLLILFKYENFGQFTGANNLSAFADERRVRVQAQ